MVTLFVSDLDQLTVLEYLLYTHGVEHKIELNDGRFGMQSPYLMVHGVPLDEKRAIRWVTHRLEDCNYE